MLDIYLSLSAIPPFIEYYESYTFKLCVFPILHNLLRLAEFLHILNLTPSQGKESREDVQRDIKGRDSV